MTRFLMFALIVFAAWYGWHHYSELRETGSSQVIAVNHTGGVIERLRISVGDRTVVVESLSNGATAKQPFKCDRDGSFKLVWELRGVMGEKMWQGGTFSHGPILLAHKFEFRERDGVIWSSEKLPTK